MLILAPDFSFLLLAIISYGFLSWSFLVIFCSIMYLLVNWILRFCYCDITFELDFVYTFTVLFLGLENLCKIWMKLCAAIVLFLISWAAFTESWCSSFCSCWNRSILLIGTFGCNNWSKIWNFYSKIDPCRFQILQKRCSFSFLCLKLLAL